MEIVCGDFHAYFKKVNKFLNKKPDVDLILQCGDFGYWPKFHNVTYATSYGRKKGFDQYALRNKETKIYFCDGNHEDHESLAQLTNNEIMKNVFYMKRGFVLTLSDGRKVLFIGGAYSIDKQYRTPGKDWFPEETISQQDIYNLPDENIDIVISHTCPSEFKVHDYHEDYYKDPSREALSFVLQKYQPKLWYFGHMHLFKQGFDNNCQWTCLSSIESSQQWWIELENK